jgi:S-adenosylmethionine hydrolase
MNSSLVTLTTDFGWNSPYVAAVKGVILARAPQAQVQDLSHSIPAQDIGHAAYFLRDAIPWFPPETIHVIVVDPGVGTSRAALGVTLDGQHLLCPDNGVWTLIPQKDAPRVRLLTNTSLWLQQTSATFHGRDIFAPCAAALAQGLDPSLLGTDIFDWIRLHVPPCTILEEKIVGEVVFIDSFGNLLTNIPRQAVNAPVQHVLLENMDIPRFVSTYGAAESGELVALFGSNGNLEIAIVNGNASRQLTRAMRGSPVEVLLSQNA